ncbi:MauE/DoxX family redox-associated membrane protein [Halodesulfovibrio aestuarii]|uniref:MauE/DoxX family redox-associated membrane protein n=1 Tax=Halodesulfovibrio aestuarii TaxID=126333 RepID=A0A8G2C9G5_9BACT|nr:MauE/DoxX family redox-associated membrane protein [Halodesulfovibrio aestuarii]SHJ09089.1 Methylamine utilisation protein MauE [Halodesulfovibrio aestuarii]
MIVPDNFPSCIFQRATAVLVVRIFLGSVFIYAGAGKLWDLHGFAIIIEEFGVLPLGLLPFVAVGLPVLEILAGVGLVWNVRGSLTVITAMNLMFMAVLGYAMYKGLVIADCGCFAAGEVPSGYDDGSALRDAFIRDVGLLSACCFLFVSSMRKKQGVKIL